MSFDNTKSSYKIEIVIRTIKEEIIWPNDWEILSMPWFKKDFECQVFVLRTREVIIS